MKGAPPPAGFLWRHPAHLYALGFGTGLAPVAPGTFGTLVALPIAFALWRYADAKVFAATFLLLGAVGVWAAGRTGRDLGVPDHGAIVCDEFVAFLLVLYFTGPDAMSMLVGFVLFRIFDIVKPPPIGWLDRRWKNGFGVMADDLLAAGYVLAVLAVWRRLAG
ncbi:MAG: phosphatidylglycerophosphatase A [Pseudomonadota bacterium]|nr:phosphatidylglycerophosphatase A [Pseudomonadota bacterium]